MTTRAERRRQEREAKSAASKIQAPAETNAANVQSHLFSSWLEQLHALPADASEWDQALEFNTAVTNIATAKLVEQGAALKQAVAETLDGIAESFASELRYLEVDPKQLASSAGIPMPFTTAEELATELRAALQDYAEIHPQAATRTEEALRASERVKRGQAALSAFARWEKLRNSSSPDIDDALQDMPDPKELKRKLTDFRQKLDKTQAALDKRTEEREDAREEIRALRAHIAKLERERGESTLTSPRSADGPDPASADRPDIASVPAAIDAARQMYEPDRLIIALNSRSKSDTSYKRPVEVYEALDWLATEYYDHHTDLAGSGADFDLLLKQRVKGWFYSAKQSVTAIGKYREEYVTSVDGREYVLEEHIGEGTRGDPKNMIRIAFDWDSDRRKVVVGYIGPHQQTDAT